MIRLTREVRLSLVPPENRLDVGTAANTWAGFPMAVGLAPFVCIRATLVGNVDEKTGYLCDIKSIEELLQVAMDRVIRSTTDLYSNPSALLTALGNEIPNEFVPGAECEELQLIVSPYCRYTIRRESTDMVEYTEQFEFSAAHRLHSQELSDEENRAIFGKCNNPNGHGHNYVVEVTVRTHQRTFQATSRTHLLQTVKKTVIDRFDHKHLNLDTEEFRETNPTVENITKVVWELLCETLKPLELTEVKVYETPKTWARVTR